MTSAVVEWLTVRLDSRASVSRYVALDATLWTPFLARQEGFLGKEVWLDPERPNEVNLVVRWRDRAAWKAVPAEEQRQVERAFAARFAEPQDLVATRGFDLVG